MAITTTPKVVSLNGDWNLYADGKTSKTKDHKTSALPQNIPTKRISMRIPGDNAAALLGAKLLPDPYFGDNENLWRFLGETPWIIEREFTVEKDALAYPGIFLHMSFVDTTADVYINNTLVGRTSNMFARYEFDVKKYVVVGKNNIRIAFESHTEAARSLSKKLPFPIPSAENYPQYLQDVNVQLLRKTQCHGGWDWGITLMVSGVYADIELRCTNNTRIAYATHAQKHSARGVTVTATAEIDALHDARHTVYFSLAHEKLYASANATRVAVTADLRKGRNTVSCRLLVEHPELWFPAGYGTQPLYVLEISTDDGASLKQKIGLRDLKIINKKDAHGVSFVVTVNGTSVFCKGANWIPTDAIPSRQTPGVYRRLLSDAVRANMNMLRICGVGQYEHEAFYDICDELGIMIWHDFMFACSLFPSEQWFLDEIEREITHQVKRLQHRACIALWCGDNEVIGALNWYKESRANRDRYVANYVKLNSHVEKLCKAADSTRMFWPSSPCGGAMDFGDSWHDDSSGDMHFWDVWHSGSSFEAYYKVKPRFCSEFGFQSFPSMPTIWHYADAEHCNITAPHMEHHQKSPRGNSIILEMFSRYFRIPDSFERQVYLSQVQQALAIGIGIEFWRSTRPVCMGTLFWQLNDNWPVASWASIDYFGRWKLLHYKTKRAFEPVLLTMRCRDNVLEVWAINDTPDSITINAAVTLHTFKGTEIFKRNISSKVSGETARCIYTCPVSWDTHAHFASLVYGNPNKKREETETVVFEPYKKCVIPHANVRHEVSVRTDNTYAVKIWSDIPAFFVSLEQDNDVGIFDDNMLSLLPQQPRTVIFTPRSCAALSKEQFVKGLKINWLNA